MGIFKSLGVPEMSRSSTRCFLPPSKSTEEDRGRNNYGIRKNLLDYDQVNNEQREIIYKRETPHWTERA